MVAQAYGSVAPQSDGIAPEPTTALCIVLSRSRNTATTRGAEVAIAGGAVLYRCTGGRLCCLGPAFAQTQDAGTRGTTFALSRPGLTFCVDPITGQSRTTRRDEHRAHPVWPPRDRIRLGVYQEWLTHPIPSH